MKKTIIVIAVSLTLFISGVLYGMYDNSNETQNVTIEQAYKSHYPVAMPDVGMQPMTEFIW